MSTLAHLNELRTAVGKAPLKAWKESKAKLLEAIDKLTPRDSAGNIIAADANGVIASGAPRQIDISELTPESHPIAKANKDSWNAVIGKPKKSIEREAELAHLDVRERKLVKATKKEVRRQGEKQYVHAVEGDEVTLVQIAKELGINPRVARAKMRRVDLSKLPAGSVIGKHTYTVAGAAAVREALKTDFRKK